jgi:hypothetical protein
MSYLDNTPTTKIKFDRKAELNLSAYSSAYRNEINRKSGADFLIILLGKLSWYFLLFPALFILHFLFQCVLAIFTSSKKVKNTHLKNTEIQSIIK